VAAPAVGRIAYASKHVVGVSMEGGQHGQSEDAREAWRVLISSRPGRVRDAPRSVPEQQQSSMGAW
jgi:hypothetical protein